MISFVLKISIDFWFFLVVLKNYCFFLFLEEFKLLNNQSSGGNTEKKIHCNYSGMDDFCQKNCLSYPPNCPEVNRKSNEPYPERIYQTSS